MLVQVLWPMLDVHKLRFLKIAFNISKLRLRKMQNIGSNYLLKDYSIGSSIFLQSHMFLRYSYLLPMAFTFQQRPQCFAVHLLHAIIQFQKLLFQNFCLNLQIIKGILLDLFFYCIVGPALMNNWGRWSEPQV